MDSFRTILTFFVSSIFLSCSPSSPALLDAYIEEFEDEFEQRQTSKTRVKFVRHRHIYIQPQQNGKCVRFPWSNKVYINSLLWEYWKKESVKKWALVYHELGHCSYGLDHFNKMKSNSCPKSMMHKYYLTYDNCFDEKEEQRYYIEELRNRIRRSIH